MKSMKEKIDWIFYNHEITNHKYDDYLPYRFHLEMVAGVGRKFKHLVEEIVWNDVELALIGHDLIEDTRLTYNDVKNVLGVKSADLIYALTNEKGKNREERANTKYYEGIRAEKYGVFVKLCDRIANVQYSKMTQSRMFDMYCKENPKFEKMLGRYTENQYLEIMFKYLEDILTTN